MACRKSNGNVPSRRLVSGSGIDIGRASDWSTGDVCGSVLLNARKTQKPHLSCR